MGISLGFMVNGELPETVRNSGSHGGLSMGKSMGRRTKAISSSTRRVLKNPKGWLEGYPPSHSGVGSSSYFHAMFFLDDGK